MTIYVNKSIKFSYSQEQWQSTPVLILVGISLICLVLLAASSILLFLGVVCYEDKLLILPYIIRQVSFYRLFNQLPFNLDLLYHRNSSCWSTLWLDIRGYSSCNISICITLFIIGCVSILFRYAKISLQTNKSWVFDGLQLNNVTHESQKPYSSSTEK
jgi:hypothetical protein